MPKQKPLSIGEYLIQALMNRGLGHVFGIPGDYVLGFYDMLYKSPIEVIGTCKEDGAGFAADAYARINGIGACCITYSVGGYSVLNAIAGAHAEKSPVVVLTGSPGLSERDFDPMLHHKVGGFETQRDVFRRVTESAVILDDPEQAFDSIEESLDICLSRKSPVYIEIPRDCVDLVPRTKHKPKVNPLKVDAAAKNEAMSEILDRLSKAKKPMILAGIEMHRWHLADELMEFSEKSGIPVAVTVLGKSLVSETHPNFVGIYEGAMGHEEVRKKVENSDCLLLLGAFLTDINLGIFTGNLDSSKIIAINSREIQVGYHHYQYLDFSDMIQSLVQQKIKKKNLPVRKRKALKPLKPRDKAIQVESLMRLLNERLNERMAVVADVGLCLFASVDLEMRRRTEFVAPAYYTSMGFAVPAALGVAAANKKIRPIVIVGDGAFQMTGMELSSILKAGQDPIVLLLNNRGYTTERMIKEGPYNDIHEWNYHEIPKLLGQGWACEVETEKDFAEAWEQALKQKTYSLLSISLDALDTCPSLQRLGKHLSSRLES